MKNYEENSFFVPLNEETNISKNLQIEPLVKNEIDHE